MAARLPSRLLRGVSGIMTTPRHSFSFTASGATDVGRVRRHNEDSYLERSDIGLWAVADGMGGHAAGDLASQMIVENLQKVEPPVDAVRFLGAVNRQIHDAHDSLRQEAARRGDGRVIGSTVVALLVRDGHFACLWAGDSRAYLLRDGGLRQLSRDHSLVQDLVDSGQIAPEEAESHPNANVVTRAVGASEELELDKRNEPLRDGDVFVLCSDGLSRLAAPSEIAALLQRHPGEGGAQALVDLALDRGAPDNVTVVVVTCRGGDGEAIQSPAPESVFEEEREDTLRTVLAGGPGGRDVPAGDAEPVERDSLDDLLAPDGDDSGPGKTDASDGMPRKPAAGDPLAEILADGPEDRRTGNRLNLEPDPPETAKAAKGAEAGAKRGLFGLFGRFRGS